MRRLNRLGLGAFTLFAVSVVTLGASNSGCSSEDEAAVATEAGVDADVDSGVVVVDSGPTGPCQRCVEFANADRRIPGGSGTCTEDSLPYGTAKSSKQIFDEAFQCVCGDKCKDSCGDSCGTGAALSPLCTACAASECLAEYNECLADDPLIAQDSGAVEVDSGVDDSGAVVDSGIVDAGGQ